MKTFTGLGADAEEYLTAGSTVLRNLNDGFLTRVTSRPVPNPIVRFVQLVTVSRLILNVLSPYCPEGRIHICRNVALVTSGNSHNPVVPLQSGASGNGESGNPHGVDSVMIVTLLLG